MYGFPKAAIVVKYCKGQLPLMLTTAAYVSCCWHQLLLHAGGLDGLSSKAIGEEVESSHCSAEAVARQGCSLSAAEGTAGSILCASLLERSCA